MTIIRLPGEHAEAMIAHALAEEPFECCGLLAISDGRVVEVYPTRPELGTKSAVRYSIDSRDLLKYLPRIEAAGHQLGIFHSHTHSEAFPSATDVTFAAYYPEAVYLIVSLLNRRAPVIRAFSLDGGEIVERLIEGRHATAGAPPAGEKLIMTVGQRDAILDHVRAGRPNESCGLLRIENGRVSRVFPTANKLASPVRYEIPPEDVLRIGHTEILWQGFDLGIFHSHVGSEAFPSQVDRELAYYPQAYYVLVSLRDPDQPVLRAFRIVEPETGHDWVRELDLAFVLDTDG
ncbi:MAG TPA: M67 family metallopeptidase [Dehalococcoidia bacterium]|nr:M67 family metallopeptidase [Dehalococcoidia bacterium]